MRGWSDECLRSNEKSMESNEREHCKAKHSLKGDTDSGNPITTEKLWLWWRITNNRNGLKR